MSYYHFAMLIITLYCIYEFIGNRRKTVEFENSSGSHLLLAIMFAVALQVTALMQMGAKTLEIVIVSIITAFDVYEFICGFVVSQKTR